MVEAEPIALIVGVACSLVALVLAWRAYQGASAEQERRKREKEERDRRGGVVGPRAPGPLMSGPGGPRSA
jgi:membrane protein implicated in regulation of membrane protease activity